MTASYTSRPVKRVRRSNAELATLDEQIVEILVEENPATLRNVFYRMVVRGAVPKTDSGYDVVQRQLLKLRRSGTVPYSWVTDGTRTRRRPLTHSSLESALENTARTYRRALWDQAAEVVEVWCESDSLAGVLHPVTSKWDVPLMAARGFASESFLWAAAEEYRADGRPVAVYYFGDWDPSGVAIDPKVASKLRDFAPEIDFNFIRVAVTPAQIEVLDLPTGVPKKTDSRSKSFTGPTCEAEAIRPTDLRALCSRAVVGHLDADDLERLEMVEAEERDVLYRMARRQFR